ncbi:MAG: TIGR04255 family protein [Gemmatimonadales bacterium]|nr:TIGR04255 family protein [Gemmatimonadales bacterium]
MPGCWTTTQNSRATGNRWWATSNTSRPRTSWSRWQKTGKASSSIEEPAIAANNQGILLDIDVFNLWIPKAPPYRDLAAWFSRAHDIENQIFEGCVTNLLRERFDQQ